MRLTLSKNYFYFPLLYVGLVILYGFVGYSSFGYEDEYFNIKMIEGYGLQAVGMLQQFDLHPPGSYLADWILFSLLGGDWHLVRLVIALFTATVLIFTIQSVRKRYGNFSGLAAYFLIGLNPAILLWCRGVRWHSFFVPILLWLCITPKSHDWRYWTKCFGGLVLLGYFDYSVFILAVPILILYWRDCPDSVKLKTKNMLVFGGLFSLLYLYQLLVFVNVHFANKASQNRPLSRSLLSFAVAQLSNVGVFPVSFAGILSIIGVLGIFFLTLRFSFIANVKHNRYFLSYWVGILFLFVSGLAGKFRNFVTLSPLQGLWIATVRIDESKTKIFGFFLTCVFIGNFVGVFNVMTHQNTVKNGWNLPVREILDYVETESLSCEQDLIILTQDMVFTYLVEQLGFRVLGKFSSQAVNRSILQKTYRCALVLKTYAGGIDDELYKAMYNELALLNYDEISSFSLGFDKFYHLKRLLDARYPEYQVEVIKYSQVSNIDKLNHWDNSKSKIRGIPEIPGLDVIY